MTNLSEAIYLIQSRSFLFDHGFSIIEYTDEPKAFGNWLITLRSEKMTLKFYEDRGQVMLSCGSVSAPLGWKHAQYYDIDIVIGFLKKKPPVDFEGPFPHEIGTQLDGLVEKLKLHYNEIIELFNSDVSLSRQKELEIYWRTYYELSK